MNFMVPDDMPTPLSRPRTARSRSRRAGSPRSGQPRCGRWRRQLPGKAAPKLPRCHSASSADLPSPPSSLPREVERRGAGRRASAGRGRPTVLRARGAPGARTGLAPFFRARKRLSWESRRPVRLARASSVSPAPPARSGLGLLPPPPRAHALPHSASFKPGKQLPPHPGQETPSRSAPRSQTPCRACAPCEARARSRSPALRSGRAGRTQPGGPARRFAPLRAHSLQQSGGVPLGLEVTPGAGQNGKGLWPSPSKHLRRGETARNQRELEGG